MNEITEYRKATAEALGAVMNYAHGLIKLQGKMYRTDETPAYAYPLWIPDTDHDQMAMVEDWLWDKGFTIGLIRNQLIQETQAYIAKGASKFYEGFDESKSIAFMKAFMSYYKTK